MHLIDKEGNDTCPLLSINDLRRLRMVIDYEEGKVMFKDSPDVWHKLPTTKKGLMMIPLTKEACERYNTVPPPPEPTTKRVRKKGKDKAFGLCGCDCAEAPGLEAGAWKQAGSRYRRILLQSRPNHYLHTLANG